MNPIAWDMRYGLPNHKYLDFVARYLLIDQTSVDPFALDVPVYKLEDIYVARERVENEISRLGTKIIVGPEGSGKTTLFRKLLNLSRNSTLIVRLSLTHGRPLGSEQEWMDGKISPLAIEPLAYHLFNTYWNDLLHNSFNRGRFLSQLRRDQRWMIRLRWFYHRYRPHYPEIPGEFELMAWLNGSSGDEVFSPQVASEGILRELIHFVTYNSPLQERLDVTLSQFQSPYTQIQILIDGTEHLSSPGITRLLQDAQRLYDMYLDSAPFKLFADAALKTQLEDLRCVRQGRVTVFCLPKWDTGGLREILYRRLQAWGRGEFAEYDWGKLIPDAYLTPAAKSQFTTTIVNGARQTYQNGDGLDAPIHLLRLARGLMAACAGCWEPKGYTPPLDYNQIKELANIYWDI
jgi:energy-coupling factor transporter ATP-binding protein EcfA2